MDIQMDTGINRGTDREILNHIREKYEENPIIYIKIQKK